MRNDRSRVNTMFGGYEVSPQEVRRNRLAMVAIGVFCIGFFLLMVYGSDFLLGLKPGYDMDYLLENGAREGMHVVGQVSLTFDCFANLDNGQGKITSYYYAIPAGEGMLILKVPPKRKDAMEALLEETMEYLDGGRLPVSVVPLEGRVVLAQGRLPYLLSQYMEGIGYTQEEIKALGEPLVVEMATEQIQKARICVPVGVIILSMEVLCVVFFMLRSRWQQK